MHKISTVGLFCCDKLEETPKQKVIDLSKLEKFYFRKAMKFDTNIFSRCLPFILQFFCVIKPLDNQPFNITIVIHFQKMYLYYLLGEIHHQKESPTEPWILFNFVIGKVLVVASHCWPARIEKVPPWTPKYCTHSSIYRISS